MSLPWDEKDVESDGERDRRRRGFLEESRSGVPDGERRRFSDEDSGFRGLPAAWRREPREELDRRRLRDAPESLSSDEVGRTVVGDLVLLIRRGGEAGLERAREACEVLLGGLQEAP